MSVIQVVADNGGPVDLTSICPGPIYNPTHATMPIGYLLEGGPPPGISNLNILGCASDTTGAQGIQLVTDGVFSPGMFGNGTLTYTDPMGIPSTSAGLKFHVEVDVLGPQGQIIAGSFIATTETNTPAKILHTVTGKFAVCHVPNELVP